MAQHLVAVCVVCLLCADHLPCKQHINNNEIFNSKTIQNNIDLENIYQKFQQPQEYLNNIDSHKINLIDNHLSSTNEIEQMNTPVHKRRGRTKGVPNNIICTNCNNNNNNNNNENENADNHKSPDILLNIDNNYNNKKIVNMDNNEYIDINVDDRPQLERQKRHISSSSSSSSGDDNKKEQLQENQKYLKTNLENMIMPIVGKKNFTNDDTHLFIKKIFSQFGDGQNLIMNLTGFEEMLKLLNLHRLLHDEIEEERDTKLEVDKLQIYKENKLDNRQNNNDSCISSMNLIKRISSSSNKIPSTDPSSLSDHINNSNNTDNNNNNHNTTNISSMTDNKNSPFNNATKNKNIDNNSRNNDNNKTSTTISLNSIKINAFDIIAICPILLYHMTAQTSLERSGCISNNLLMMYDNQQQHYNNNNDHFMDNFYNTYYPNNNHYDCHRQHQHEHYHDHNHYSVSDNNDRTLVWVYAFLSILGTSLCGLLGVAVIPFMEKSYYNHILQFLVALAVGTLTGDALLHLLPHAMATSSDTMNFHTNMTLKGFVAVIGIIFFFMTERGLTMIAEWYKGKQKKEKPSSRVRVMRDPETASLKTPSTGEKLCKHKYSSYPYCYDEIAMDTRDDNHHHHHLKNTNTDQSNNKYNSGNNTSDDHHHNHQNHSHDHQHQHHDEHEQHQHTKTNGAKNIIGKGVVAENVEVIDGDECGANANDDENVALNSGIEETKLTPITKIFVGDGDGSGDNHIGDEDELKINCVKENYTIILREHESKHHGHSHTHGHVHSPPSSLSAVAWMVIMGDGLHNFTDGMAIGAAFSNNIAGGFSTAIAVFCHELPHELGDFAVLLKAGMSAKQAVYYNLLSSVLSLFGTIIGILIGDTPSASAWIFAIAAGLFIYIALVDMMPELTSTHKEKCAISQCFLQILGMTVGLCIMLLIALFEDDLKQMFTTDNNLDLSV